MSRTVANGILILPFPFLRENTLPKENSLGCQRCGVTSTVQYTQTVSCGPAWQGSLRWVQGWGHAQDSQLVLRFFFLELMGNLPITRKLLIMFQRKMPTKRPWSHPFLKLVDSNGKLLFCFVLFCLDGHMQPGDTAGHSKLQTLSSSLVSANPSHFPSVRCLGIWSTLLQGGPNPAPLPACRLAQAPGSGWEEKA